MCRREVSRGEVGVRLTRLVTVSRRLMFPYLFTRIPVWSVDPARGDVKGASTPGTPDG